MKSAGQSHNAELTITGWNEGEKDSVKKREICARQGGQVE
jgi:hypothetical protein